MSSSTAALSTNWRTINIDALDPDSAANFDLSSLTPGIVETSLQEAQQLVNQCRQLSRGGDAEGALVGLLERPSYGGDRGAKDMHSAAVTETLHQIRQADMNPLLQRLYTSENGPELLDTLMKYIYKGMQTGSVSSSSSSAGGTAGSRQSMSPQVTGSGGFSQMGGRSFGGGVGGGGETSGQAMSVLLSWHEKVVEIAGVGSIVRVMTDRRTV